MIIKMKETKQQHVSPWENHHQQQTIFNLEIDEKHKQFDKHETGKTNFVVHSVHHHPSSQQKNTKKLFESIIKNNIQTRYQLHLSQIQQKALQQKLKPHQQQKKVQVTIKPVSRTQLTINVPQYPNHQTKQHLDRPIRHMVKSNRKISSSLQPTDRLANKNEEYQELGEKFHTLRHSVDNLHKFNKTYENTIKKIQEYQNQIIKKCTLKNISIFQQPPKRLQHLQKLHSKSTKALKPKYQQKSHILDRILSKFQ